MRMGGREYVRRKIGTHGAFGLELRVVAVALCSTITAMLAAFAIYQWSNWSSDRRDLAADSIKLAQAIADVAYRATSDDDAGAAHDATAMLLGAEHAVDASYFAPDGRRLDLGGHDGSLPALIPSGAVQPKVLFREPGVEVHVPYYQEGRRLGEVVLRAEDDEIVLSRIRNIAIALALSVFATLVAGLVAWRLARRALRPLHTLAQSLGEVASSHDFTATVKVESHDEVGQLTLNFNRLLRTLQRYDANLRGALADVTAARDAAEQANVLKSQFLANMGHEVRTPLNGVLGMTQALLLDDVTPSQRERLEVIRSSGAALLCVLNDMLDLSDMENGRLQIEAVPFDVEAMVNEACAVAGILAQSKGLTFTVQIGDDARGLWEGDPVRLRQVLYNLVSNGLKFTQAGEVSVNVTRAAEGGLCFAVSDSGMGIGPDVLPRLFGKFEQGEAGATRRFGGSGLGLAICRSLVDLMGGMIEVESRRGEGSTFRVQVPLKPCVGANDEADDGEPDMAAMRVLVAEDNETNQRVVRTVLNALGVDPVIVADGQQAVEAWTKERFDLVLMDIQMPVRDGVSATRDIRRLEVEQGLARTPIVALTANAMQHQAAEYAAAGMDGLVSKPIMIEKLHAALVSAAPTLRAA